MSIVKPIEEHDAPPEVQQVYDQIKKRHGGFLPDLHKTMANDPVFLSSIVDHATSVMTPRKVDAKTKEVIAFVVSAANGCDYCTHAHAGALRQHGLDDEAITEILATAGLWESITRFAIGARLHWPAHG